MQKVGLKNRRGGEISIYGLSNVLRNPFYIGLIRVQSRKEIYEGAHDPLVKKSLFDQVQRVLDGKLSARPIKYDFLLRRTVRCKSCGNSLIGETQKGHIYCRCHTATCPITNVKRRLPKRKSVRSSKCASSIPLPSISCFSIMAFCEFSIHLMPNRQVITCSHSYLQVPPEAASTCPS